MAAAIPQSTEEFNECTWEQLNDLACEAAADPEPYLFMTDASHKMEKSIELTGIATVSTVKCLLVGVAQDVDESDAKIGFTFQMRDGLSRLQPVEMFMNEEAVTDGGWEACYMRTEIIPMLEAALPEDLKPLLRTMKKKTNMAYSGLTMTETLDKLACLSSQEVLGAEHAEVAKRTWLIGEGEQYQWYASHNTDADRICNTQDGYAMAWWHRSITSAENFCCTLADGRWSTYGANSSYRIPCPCFAIGVPKETEPTNDVMTPEQAMDLLGQAVDLIKSNLGDVAFINFPEA